MKIDIYPHPAFSSKKRDPKETEIWDTMIENEKQARILKDRIEKEAEQERCCVLARSGMELDLPQSSSRFNSLHVASISLASILITYQSSCRIILPIQPS